MSIGNKYLLIMTTALLCIFATSASALSIRVLEGGIPIIEPRKMMEDGLRLGNIELLRQAWRHYEDSVTLPEGIGNGYLELGRIYFYLSLLGSSNDSDYNLAERFARQAIADNPENADAHHALGLIFAGRGAFLDAFEELTLALQLNPTN